jgi:hypothetical protein
VKVTKLIINIIIIIVVVKSWPETSKVIIQNL